MGTITSRAIRIFQNIILDLNNPGLEFNANKIHRANYLKKNIKQQDNTFISILLKNIDVN